MDKALYIAMSGAKENMLAQRAHANNLANANTSGFKQDFAQARSMQVFADHQHYPTRAYSMAERPGTNFEPGPMIQTGNPLDIAINNEGWFVVQNGNGEPALTRAGQLQVDVNGQVLTESGFPILGGGGPLAVPPGTAIEFGTDGTVSALIDNNLQQVGQLQLVNPDPATLEKRPDGFVYVRDGEPVPDPNVSISTGFYEGSNVNSVNELTDILALTRQYQIQIKMMTHAEEMSSHSARLLQFS